VMEQLYPVDEVAYVRFASVYRQFKDINMFMKELTEILAKNQLGDSILHKAANKNNQKED